MRRFSLAFALLLLVGGPASAQTAQQVMNFIYQACLVNLHGTSQQCSCWTQVALGQLTAEDDAALMNGQETPNSLRAEQMATAQCMR